MRVQLYSLILLRAKSIGDNTAHGVFQHSGAESSWKAEIDKCPRSLYDRPLRSRSCHATAPSRTCAPARQPPTKFTAPQSRHRLRTISCQWRLLQSGFDQSGFDLFLSNDLSPHPAICWSSPTRRPNRRQADVRCNSRCVPGGSWRACRPDAVAAPR